MFKMLGTNAVGEDRTIQAKAINTDRSGHQRTRLRMPRMPTLGKLGFCGDIERPQLAASLLFDPNQLLDHRHRAAPWQILVHRVARGMSAILSLSDDCVAKLSLRQRLSRDSVDQDVIRGSGR
jgi:hypothetical protein